MIRAKDVFGNTYVWDRRGWTAEAESAYAQATLANLNMLERYGRGCFPGVRWSDALPPRRDYEDNLILAAHQGLEVVETEPVLEQWTDY